MKNIYTKSIEEVNGQDLFFLNFEEWNNFLLTEEFKNFKLKNIFHKKIKRDLDLMCFYPELQLTIGFVRDDKYLPYMLIKLNSFWQRISIEKRTCMNCKWEGLVGLTNVMDIYIGVPEKNNKIKIIKDARLIEKKGCPNCGNHFEDHVIWVEKK
jgi:hypothetical protein